MVVATNTEVSTAREKGKGVMPGVIQFRGEKRVEVGVEKNMSYHGGWDCRQKGSSESRNRGQDHWHQTEKDKDQM